jgi:beta-N-acetylhexosaminidase
VIVGELEQKLGFQGLVMTDAVNAKAIRAAGYTVPEASVRALKAGADMVLFGQVAHVLRETNTIASAIVSAVQHEKLARGRLIAAAEAVLAVRGVDLCSAA